MQIHRISNVIGVPSRIRDMGDYTLHIFNTFTPESAGAHVPLVTYGIKETSRKSMRQIHREAHEYACRLGDIIERRRRELQKMDRERREGRPYRW